MKSSTKPNWILKVAGVLPALLLAAGLGFGGTAPARAGQSSKVIPPNASPHGQTYGEWSAAWWQWAMELPVDGHPFVDDAGFDVRTGQSGHVWFLAAPFGTVERTCTIPTGTMLFIGLLNAEASDLEGLGATEAERRATAEWIADHIVTSSLSCTIDGKAVANLGSYRVQSPEFSFTAPTPWIFGSTGGDGVAVADGYFVMLAPLSAGQHTIHFGGTFHFDAGELDADPHDFSLDMTYHLTVGKAH